MGDRTNNMGKMLNNPKQRNMYFLIIGVAAVTLLAGVYFATRNHTPAAVGQGANVAAIPQVNVVPGTATNPEYTQKVAAANDKGAQQALQGNTSFVPTATARGANDVSPIDLVDKQREEAARRKAEQDAHDAAALAASQAAAQPVVQVQPVQPVVQPVVVAQAPIPAPVKKPRYSNEDYVLIATLSKSWGTKASSSEYDFAKSRSNENTGAAAATAQAAQAAASTTATAAPLAKAGTVFNAILESSINSDEPSPVLAKIVSGPLKGTRLIGSIKNTGEKVIVQFTVANMPNQASSVKINAVAVDPETSRSALATDVDHHYFERYGVLLGAAFLSGWSNAIQRQNTTTSISDTGSVIVSQGNLSSSDINKQALGQVGNQLANSVQQDTQNMRPTVKVDGGIAIGIMLLDDLIVK